MTSDRADEDLEALVQRVADGDADAWQRLWSAVEPQLSRLVANPSFLARLGQREDDRRNVIVEVMARLRADDFQRLWLFLDARRANPQLRLMTWLRVVAKRVGIDYLRGHPDYLDRRRDRDRGDAAAGAWIDPATLPPASQLPGERPPVTNRGTAAQLLRFAADTIPDVQRRALEMWVLSESYEEIARRLELADAGEAERTVRAAIERLRRRFRGGES
jgi:hypothetical protein